MNSCRSIATVLLLVLNMLLWGAPVRAQIGLANKSIAAFPFAYDPVRIPHIIVQARVNGSKPLNFILDSGVGVDAILDTAVASKMSLRNTEAIYTIANYGKAKGLQDASISLWEGSQGGDEVLASPVVASLPIDKIFSGLYPKGYIAGVIGWPFFKDKTIHLDFQKREIKLFPRNTVPNEIAYFTHLNYDTEKTLYSCELSLNGLKQNLYFGTGSPDTFIGSELAIALKPSSVKSMKYRDSKGVFPGKEYQYKQVNIAEAKLPDVTLSEGKPGQDTLIGLNLLSRFRVLLSFSGKYIFLSPVDGKMTDNPFRVKLP
jgi:hypothetical protein